MASEYVGAVGALAGVVTGGVMNYFFAYRTKLHEWKLVLAKDQAAMQRKLYAEFLVEAQRLVMLAIEEKVASASDLIHLNSKIAELGLVASDPVMKIATKLADHAITAQVPRPAKEAANFFALKTEFIAVARKDIEEMLHAAWSID